MRYNDALIQCTVCLGWKLGRRHWEEGLERVSSGDVTGQVPVSDGSLATINSEPNYFKLPRVAVFLRKILSSKQFRILSGYVSIMSVIMLYVTIEYLIRYSSLDLTYYRI